LTALGRRPSDTVPPLTPDAEEARRWAEQELSDPAYAEAEPTLLDRVARAVSDFLGDLFSSQPSTEWGAVLAVIAAVVVVALIVVALLVWGVPRATPRAPAPVGELFGVTEKRSAADLRKDAAQHAAAGDWDAAIIDRVRAIARALAERGAVQTPPGATVHAFARAATAVFPTRQGDLDAVADTFDDVRYLRRPGSAELYERVVRLDDDLARTSLANTAGVIP
jgi:hypothetical protein